MNPEGDYTRSIEISLDAKTMLRKAVLRRDLVEAEHLIVCRRVKITFDEKHYVTMTGQVEMAQLLCDKGDAEFDDRFKSVYVSNCINGGHVAMLGFLLERIPSSVFWSPGHLDMIIAAGNFEMAKLVVAKGAAVKEVHVHVARSRGHHDIAAFLAEHITPSDGSESE